MPFVAVVAKPGAKPKPTPGALLVGFVLLLVLPAVLFAAVFVYTKYEHARTSPPPPGQHGALVWSDGQVIFANTNEVAAWVKQHGGNFHAFKRNHPAAVKLVTRRHVARTHTKLAAGTKQTAPAKPKPVTTSNRQAVAAVPSSGGGTTVRTGDIALGVLAALLLILAFLPTAVLWQVRVFRTERIPELRLMFGSGSLAIAAGLAFALFL